MAVDPFVELELAMQVIKVKGARPRDKSTNPKRPRIRLKLVNPAPNVFVASEFVEVAVARRFGLGGLVSIGRRKQPVSRGRVESREISLCMSGGQNLRIGSAALAPPP